MGIAADLALALDPARMMMQAGLPPDPWQQDVLRHRYHRLLLNCSRQSGKSTVTAGLVLHPAIYEPGSLMLLLAPSERQSKELFRKVLTFYRAVDRPVGFVSANTEEVEFVNESRIVCLPGKEASVRGYSSVRRLIVDEAARVPDALYRAIRPMLAVSGGDIVALSTPFGKRGWFYEEWAEGEEDDWKRVEIAAAQCPRISPAFLAEERRKLGDWWFEQEYCCKFKDAVDSVFRYEDVQGALSESVTPLFAVKGAAA
jgi:hypothetical protein